MLTYHTKSANKKKLFSKKTRNDELLKTLIERRSDKLLRLRQRLVEENNPTLQSIMKVENLFKKHIEFNSRSHLFRELKGSMKPVSLNTVITHLVTENKLIVNDDRSLTWIDTEGNEKLNKVFDRSVRL